MMKSATARGVAATACSLLLLAPAAQAQSDAPPKPAVTTGGVEQTTPTGTTIKGSVDPNGKATQAFVQYGPNGRYTTTTPPVDVGGGNRRVAVKIPISGLSPVTKYQYRLVASSVNGRTNGTRRTFTTPKIPASVTLAAAPLKVVFGQTVTFSGTVGGTGAGGSKVQPQIAPVPFTGFSPLGNALIASPEGAYSFTHAPNGRTQYRAQATVEGAEAFSPILTIEVAPKVTFRYKRVSGGRVKFFGTVSPAGDAVVKLRRLDAKNHRTTVSKTTTSGSSPSRFSFKSRTIKRTARWVVRVEPVNPSFSGTESEIRKVRKRR